MRLLIIEDDPVLGPMYKEVFEDAYEVDMCRTFSEAIKLTNEIVYHMILLDVMLPGKNGDELLSEIRTLGKNKMTKVIGLTNLSDGKIQKRLISLGVDEILLKVDHDPLEILDIINSKLLKI